MAKATGTRRTGGSNFYFLSTSNKKPALGGLHSVGVAVVSPSRSLTLYALPDGFFLFWRHAVPLSHFHVGAATPLTFFVVQGGADCDARAIGPHDLDMARRSAVLYLGKVLYSDAKESSLMRFLTVSRSVNLHLMPYSSSCCSE